MVSLHHHHLHHRAPASQDSKEMEHMDKRDPEPQLVSVVLVTLRPTFTGEVAGYTTIDDELPSYYGGGGSTIVGEPVQQPATITDSGAFVSSEASLSPTGEPDSQVIPSSSTATSSYATPTSTSSVSTASLLSTTSAVIATTFSSSQQHNTASPNTSSSSDSATANSSRSGLPTGAKVGLAIGIILLLAAATAGALFFFAKKKRRDEREAVDNEKSTFGMAAVPNPPVSSNTSNGFAPAPRLSLRPMSRLLPEFGGGAKKRTSHGNMLNTFYEAPVSQRSNMTPSLRAQSPWERRREEAVDTSNPFNDPQNPFADPQRAAPLPSAGMPLRPEMAPASTHTATAATAGFAAATTVAATAAAEEARQYNAQSQYTSQPQHVAQPQKEPNPPSASAIVPAVDVTAVGSNHINPTAGPLGQVFRVQMDFKPKMDDELELRAGELVRLTHEYDDGWALCIRLDRSQQGVAPRTCLAAQPSKPRPPPGAIRGPGPGGPIRSGPNVRMGPPVHRSVPSGGSGYGGRPSPAMDRPASPSGQTRGSRPGTPNGGRPGQPREQMRPMSPGGYNQAPRPLSPGPRPIPQRSMSPGPYELGGTQKPRMPAAKRQRSNSAGALNVRERRENGLKPSRLGPGSPPDGRASPGLAM